MPLFPFKCPQCAATKDELMKYSEVEAGIAPKCESCKGAPTMERQMTSATPQFKGSGFYATDHQKRRQ